MTDSTVAAPFPAAQIQAALERAGCPWREVESVASTGSTNADLLDRVAGGAPEGLVLVSDLQVSGRGRLDRGWEAPPGTALTFSLLLRPVDVEMSRWSWLPLLVGVAVCDAVREVSGLQPGLKWPNDLVFDRDAPRKVGGILSEVSGQGLSAAAVIGVGLNVSMTAEQLPVPEATSLLLEGAPGVDRVELLAAALTGIATRLGDWRAAAGEPGELLDDYRDRCLTLGREVRVGLPDGELTGHATGIDPQGRLVVAGVPVASGDVTHVRPA